MTLLKSGQEGQSSSAPGSPHSRGHRGSRCCLGKAGRSGLHVSPEASLPEGGLLPARGPLCLLGCWAFLQFFLEPVPVRSVAVF